MEEHWVNLIIPFTVWMYVCRYYGLDIFHLSGVRHTSFRWADRILIATETASFGGGGGGSKGRGIYTPWEAPAEPRGVNQQVQVRKYSLPIRLHRWYVATKWFLIEYYNYHLLLGLPEEGWAETAECIIFSWKPCTVASDQGINRSCTGIALNYNLLPVPSRK